MVNTAVATFAALSTRSTLSTIAAVCSSPWLSHRAISPAPISTTDPVRATSFAEDSTVGGGVFSVLSLLQPNTIAASSMTAAAAYGDERVALFVMLQVG